MYRVHYRNGDEVGLKYSGCDGCNIQVVNGVVCHEQGCPYVFKDRKIECSICGFDFYPEDMFQNICSDCKNDII